MPSVPLPSSAGPELCVVARRNDSLGTRGRVTAFAAVAAVSLGVAGAFVIAGAWVVLPWSLLELGVLAAAFVCLERRAKDWERLTVLGDRVIVERMHAGRVDRCEWNRSWLQVERATSATGRCDRIVLRSAGQACEFGADLGDDARRDLLQQLARLASR
jgi:uncharacterized membrane protein